MEDGLTRVFILLIFGAISSVAGYFGRVAQKVEDRRDETYLDTLPTLYSSLMALKDEINLFYESGSIDEFSAVITTIKDKLDKAIFSSKILIFKPELHEPSYELFKQIKDLEAITKLVKGSTNKAEEVEKFQMISKAGHPYKYKSSSIDMGEIQNKITILISKVKKELEGYKSISVWIIIMAGLLGVILAAVEIISSLVTLGETS